MQFRIKGLPLSSFTAEDFEIVARASNALHNSIYLRRYSSASYPPIPTMSTDIAKLRDFIRIKYLEKRWYSESGNSSTNNISQSSCVQLGSNIGAQNTFQSAFQVDRNGAGTSSLSASASTSRLKYAASQNPIPSPNPFLGSNSIAMNEQIMDKFASLGLAISPQLCEALSKRCSSIGTFNSKYEL